ncbi:SusC/RagA family TonB-linked outer membrane protein [Petrimonas sp.]|uniref:SusC/RagA family TonB-linked outer membrane protein n=1 Tax=Petrimonas sp. TaxID=2023866 RepID=UPI003F515739
MRNLIFIGVAILLLTVISYPAYGNSIINTEQQQNTKLVTGNVRDSFGDPLPGASIIVPGTSHGTVTNAEGHFSIRVPNETKSLSISFIGMKALEVSIVGRNSIDVTLEDESIALQEVVAVGYGVQRKETVVGSVSQATEEDLKKIGSVTDLRQALSGQLPGIVSLTSSGEPGGVLTGESSTNVFIRGQNTWNGGQPLVLVDGVERSMNNVDVNEVASISVLKDASATAVFGVKGANGVILITTKRGQVGKTSLDFNYTTMGQMVSKLPEKLDSYEAMMAKNEMIEREVPLREASWGDYVPYEIVQRYRRPQTREYAVIYPNVDWADAMFKDLGLSHRATLSVRGGSQAIQFFGSLAYLHEGDMFTDYDNYKGYSPNYNFDRFNFRSNIDAQLTKTTELKLDISGFYSLKNTNFNNEGSTGRADWWMWASAYRLAPNLYLPMYEDGRWGAYQEGGNNTSNPLAAVYNLGIRQTRTTQLNFDVSLQQDLKFITEGLTARASLFYDNSIRSEGGIWDIQNSIRPNEANTNVPFKQIYPMLYKGPDQDPSEYTVLLPISDSEYDWVMRPWSIRQEVVGNANWSGYIPVERRMMYQFQMNYARRFDLHNVSALALFKREEGARGSQFKNYREDWVFRTTYDYDSKYLFEANGAYNGSEQFGPGYRFDFFPSLALGWYVSNEKFFKIDWVDRLKLRYSIGKVGDDRVSGSRWMYSSQYEYGGRSRLSNNTAGWSPYYFYRESVVGNPNIRWETALKNNWGLELGVLRNLLSLNFDYYTENRTDILLGGGSRNIPPFFGATPPSANLGKVKSKGFEIELRFDKRFTPDIQLWSNLAITHNQNKIIFRDDAPLQFDYLKQAGYPIGQQRSLISTGFYNNWDQVYGSVPTENNDLDKMPGYYNLLDFNSDGIIKNSEDTPPIGYSEVPQNTANLSVGFRYKRVSGMVQLYGVNNVSRYVNSLNFFNYTDVLFSHVSDYWSKDNPDATSFLPRWKTQANNIGDYYQFDASSFRLRTAEIAYSFNGMEWVKRAGISNMRIFLNGNNLFLWTRLPDDRESTYSGGGATEGSYPTMRRINLGIDLSF